MSDLCLYAEVAFSAKRGHNDHIIPPEAEDVWLWFLDLDRTRQVGMQANPISYSEISAYAGMTRIELEPWQVAAIRTLDDIALAARTSKAGKGGKPAKERDPEVLISAKDGAGVSGLMQGLAAKAKRKA